MKITSNMKSELEHIRDGWKLKLAVNDSSPWRRTNDQGFTVKVAARTGDALLANGLIVTENGRDHDLTALGHQVLADLAPALSP
jgi:hypothetical protein